MENFALMETLPAALVERIQISQGKQLTADGNWTADSDLPVNATPGALANNVDAVVLAEDAHDLEAEITKGYGKIGMLILVGQPRWKNKAAMQNPNVEDVINIEIGIGENPPIWRLPGTKRNKAMTVAHIIEKLVHNFKIPGFQYLKVTDVQFVPDKKRNIYEVQCVTQLVAPVLAN